MHRNCTGLTNVDFELAVSNTTWFCRICNDDIFPLNHLDDDDFLKAVCEMSQTIDIILKIGNESRLFHPFELNEDENDILDYHGDLDPDKCYFNQYSHSLIKNCNYFVEETFDKYLLRHNVSQHSFSIMHLNIRSIPANFTSFLTYLDNVNHRFSVIGLTETWLKQPNIPLYGIPGYSHIGITRSHGNGGGVSLFISDVFMYSELTELCMVSDYIECIFVKIMHSDLSYVIGVMYRPPNSNIVMFNEKLNDILSQISHMPCYIIGDYNIDLLKHDGHLQTEQFLDVMHSNSLIPMIYKPTRETNTTATLIDNIFTNNYCVDDLLLQGLLIADISDHHAIFHIRDKCIPAYANDQYQLIRLCNEQRIAAYKDSICNIDWSILDEYVTCESYFLHFLSIFKSVYDKSFPIIRVKKQYRNRLPWLTTGLKESIKRKNKLSQLSLRHPTVYNVTQYKRYRNMVTKLLKQQEKEYYQSQIVDNKNNLRKTWMIIKKVINQNRINKNPGKFHLNNGTTSDPSTIASAFNNYFVNIGPTLASKIPDLGLQYRAYMPSRNEFSMFLTPVSELEIKKIIGHLKDGSPGKDGVTSKSLKYVIDHIAQPLSHLANLSFLKGIFPNELKIAQVSPIYKAKDAMFFSNYRPISLLSTFSKILEKLMYDRLLAFLNKNDILNKYQFGFRNNHSTYMALVILLENLRNALDNGECAVGIFLDFQKAFDTVDHCILLDKLNIYGVRGTTLEWFSSYLSDRYQYVVYNDCKSDCKQIKCGVPQGSILGPLLFLIFINDLPSVSKLFMPILFADDTNLFCTGNDLDLMVERINVEMANVYAWVKANKLSLNVDKTNFMLFTPKRWPRSMNDILIDKCKINEVEETKFLGVIIDNTLKWSSHLKYISGKIAKGIGVVIKARKVFSPATLLSLYNSLIMPYLTYCIHVWGKAYDTHLSHLMSLQNKVVRIIAGVSPRTHAEPLYADLNIMPL